MSGRLVLCEKRVSDEVESYRNEFNQQVTGEMTEQVRNSVWSEMVKERVMLGQVQEAGFTITKEEYDDVRFGNNVLPDFRGQQQFQGPDGQPNKEALQQYLDAASITDLDAADTAETQAALIREFADIADWNDSGA